MKIGILGGSFDPIHKGHLTLARESQKQFGLEKVLFVPARVPPHKTKDFHLTPARDRARMVELALAGERGWELCDIELKREGVSYTVDTLKELRRIRPAPDEFYFIAGADSFCDLKHWKSPEEIMRLSQWIVAPRPSFPLPEPLPPGVHLLRILLVPVSATELREKIRRGEDVSEWVPEQAAEYMKKRKIYG